MTELPEPTLEELELEATIRRIAREEIASMAGLVLRRTQDEDEPSGGPGDGIATRIASIFGEVLNDFTTDAEPGQ